MLINIEEAKARHKLVRINPHHVRPLVWDCCLDKENKILRLVHWGLKQFNRREVKACALKERNLTLEERQKRDLH
jgi:hypothetical protein